MTNNGWKRHCRFSAPLANSTISVTGVSMRSVLRKVTVLPRGSCVRGAPTKAHVFGRSPFCWRLVMVLEKTFEPGPSLQMSAKRIWSYQQPHERSKRVPPSLISSVWGGGARRRSSPLGTSLRYGQSMTSNSFSVLSSCCSTNPLRACKDVTTPLPYVTMVILCFDNGHFRDDESSLVSKGY